MGRLSKSPYPIPPALTPNGVNRVSKGSFPRISSDQFRQLQTDSTAVSEDRAQYRLTCRICAPSPPYVWKF
jgi:hypothetical protein